mgnify:CR=1 FL=1
MLKESGIIVTGLLAFLSLTGCMHKVPVMVAEYTAAEPDISMAGKVWKQAPEYHFLPYTAGTWYEEIERANGMRDRVLEPGSIKLLWNENFLYIGVKMTDSDLVDEAERNQTHIFLLADTVELFIKPGNHPYYWEIYGSVNAKKTCYFYPGRGRLGLPVNDTYKHGVEVETILNGTLNDDGDHDRGWTLMLKIPAAELTRYGAKWDATEKWTIHLVRHNYSVYLPSREVSAYPEFKAGNPHFYEGYANLILDKKTAGRQ